MMILVDSFLNEAYFAQSVMETLAAQTRIPSHFPRLTSVVRASSSIIVVRTLLWLASANLLPH